MPLQIFFTPGVKWGIKLVVDVYLMMWNRIAAAVANPDEWKPSESALDFALRDFSENPYSFKDGVLF